MVAESVASQNRERYGVVTRVANQLGIGIETLRYWVKQAEIDSGTWPGTTTEERRRIAEPERENKELRRSNEILKAAATFFRERGYRCSIPLSTPSSEGSRTEPPSQRR